MDINLILAISIFITIILLIALGTKALMVRLGEQFCVTTQERLTDEQGITAIKSFLQIATDDASEMYAYIKSDWNRNQIQLVVTDINNLLNELKFWKKHAFQVAIILVMNLAFCVLVALAESDYPELEIMLNSLLIIMASIFMITILLIIRYFELPRSTNKRESIINFLFSKEH